jgi:hypothetical protein
LHANDWAEKGAVRARTTVELGHNQVVESIPVEIANSHHLSRSIDYRVLHGPEDTVAVVQLDGVEISQFERLGDEKMKNLVAWEYISLRRVQAELPIFTARSHPMAF